MLLLFGFPGDDWNSSTAKTISAMFAGLVLLYGVAVLIGHRLITLYYSVDPAGSFGLTAADGLEDAHPRR